MIQYRTKTDDMLDAIVYQQYGNVSPLTDVINANPGLVNHPEKLPAGLLINLPTINIKTTTIKTVRLWN